MKNKVFLSAMKKIYGERINLLSITWTFLLLYNLLSKENSPLGIWIRYIDDWNLYLFITYLNECLREEKEILKTVKNIMNYY